MTDTQTPSATKEINQKAGKINNAVATLLDLKYLLNCDVQDSNLWIDIVLKYLQEATDAEEFYNQEVVEVHHIISNKLNYIGAVLHINQCLNINTRHFCIHVVNDDKSKWSRLIPDSFKETVIALDEIAQKAYQDAKYRKANKLKHK